MKSHFIIAALAATSLICTPAHAQQAAAGAASSSSSSASSAAASNASITNKGQLQLIPGTAIGIAASPTATCQRTRGFGISIPFFGISTSSSKPDRECMFVQMLDRTILMGPYGSAMACQLAYNHWQGPKWKDMDWQAASDTLGIDCRMLLPNLAPPPPPPPMVMAAPPPPPEVITRVETKVVTRVVYRDRPVHRRVVRHKRSTHAAPPPCVQICTAPK